MLDGDQDIFTDQYSELFMLLFWFTFYKLSVPQWFCIISINVRYINKLYCCLLFITDVRTVPCFIALKVNEAYLIYWFHLDSEINIIGCHLRNMEMNSVSSITS